MKPVMKKIIPVTAALVASFALSVGLATQGAAQIGAPHTAQGMPYLSDGSVDISVDIYEGVASFNACGTEYYLPNESSLKVYRSMNLRRGGYIYYHTDDQYKKWYDCGWGSYAHLNGVLK